MGLDVGKGAEEEGMKEHEKLILRLLKEDPDRVYWALEQLKSGLPSISRQEPDMDREVIAAILETWADLRLRKSLERDLEEQLRR
jgi:hypothetical protein